MRNDFFSVKKHWKLQFQGVLFSATVEFSTDKQVHWWWIMIQISNRNCREATKQVLSHLSMRARAVCISFGVTQVCANRASWGRETDSVDLRNRIFSQIFYFLSIDLMSKAKVEIWGSLANYLLRVIFQCNDFIVLYQSASIDSHTFKKNHLTMVHTSFRIIYSFKILKLTVEEKFENLERIAKEHLEKIK